MSRDEVFDQAKFDNEHPRDEHGRFASERFDSDPFIITSRPIPKPALSEAQRQWGQTAELNRIATLNYHVRQTLSDALEALRTKGPEKTLEILQEAAPKYTRLGGPARHWKDAK